MIKHLRDNEYPYSLSLLLYIDDEKLTTNSLEGFLSGNTVPKNIQLFLLDAICSTETKRQCQLLGKRSASGQTVYLECPNMTREHCYNMVLDSENIKGRYINFSISTALLSSEALHNIKKAMKENHSVIALTPYYLNDRGKKVSNLFFDATNTAISVTAIENQPNLYLPAYFFQTAQISSLRFCETYEHENDIHYIIQVLKKNDRYLSLTDEIFSHVALESDFYNYPIQYFKSWYLESLNSFIIPMLKSNADSIMVKIIMYYLIQLKFACNMNDRHKSILDEAEIEEFLFKVNEALQCIDDEIIAKYKVSGRRFLPKYMETKFLRFKYENAKFPLSLNQAGDVELIKHNGDNYSGIIIEKLNLMKCIVYAINYDGCYLSFDMGLTNCQFAEPEELDVFVMVNGVRKETLKDEIYSLTKFFGKTMHKGYRFRYSIPIRELNHETSIVFSVTYRNMTITPIVNFAKMQSRFSGLYEGEYWNFGSKTISFDNINRSFIIKNTNRKRMFINEVQLLKSIVKKNRFSKLALGSILLRIAYWLTKPYFDKKEIWLTYDHLYKCGDNGEYFYRYVCERKDKENIKIYYIANKTAPEYAQLKKKYKTVLNFKSVKQRVVALHASKVFATRADAKQYCGFGTRLEKPLRGVFNADILCLQHGLTIQRIAQYQNRLFDNTKLYFCVSPFEIVNLIHPDYGYDKDTLIMTGASRYDGLINNDKRKILITPTWRRNVTAGTNLKGSTSNYSSIFKNTTYFQIYNSLINDEKLIACARDNNYQLIYLIHPLMSPQIKDFDTNDFIQIMAGAGDVNYEELLTQASLMLTDHSGIQFDFAYMKKPLIYYHPSELPPQYKEGELKYKTMGFGPVCEDHDTVVNALCNYMENNCRMEEFYRDKVDTFFAFDDRNNCKRIYEKTLEYTHRKEANSPN